MDENNKENKRGIVEVLGVGAIHPNLDWLFENPPDDFKAMPVIWDADPKREDVPYPNAEPHDSITEPPESPIMLKGRTGNIMIMGSPNVLARLRAQWDEAIANMEKVGITYGTSAMELAEAARTLARASGLTVTEAADRVCQNQIILKNRRSGRTLESFRKNIELIYNRIDDPRAYDDYVEPKPHQRKNKFIPQADKNAPNAMNINQKALKKRRKKKKRAKKAR